jgi:glycosyltransferase involved in cell wall biosynthesis
MDEDDRTLTARTTLRWLRALGEQAPSIEIAPAGIARPGADERRGPYRFAALPGGPELTPTVRRLLRRLDTPEPFRERPFSDPPGEPLMRWLAEPINGVPRYLAELCRRRADLREQWSDGSRESDRALLAWAYAHGRHEDSLLGAVLDPLAAPTVPATEHPVSAASPRPLARGFGVNIVGHFQSELGIADAARLVVAALDASEVPLYPISAPSGPLARNDHQFASDGPQAHPFGVNLLCLNPDGILTLARDYGPALLGARPTAGYLWWEIQGAFPSFWQPVFGLLDEVWVGSRYVQDAIEPASTVPVRLLPVPVVPLDAGGTRRRLGLPDGFLFLCVFDYDSAFERKNPLAVVRAFTEAFEPGSGAKLVVKTVNAAHQPDNRDELAIAAADHPDIELRDGYVSSLQIEQMLAAADCVASLHRAEGFGLPLARALRSGIPVVATRYGGNTDFMNAENSYPVDYTPTTVPAATIYPPRATWAEPDRRSAAEQLRCVFDDPADARRRAQRGAAELAKTHSPEATGARMAEALRRLGAGAASSPAGWRDAVRRIVQRPVEGTDPHAEEIIAHLQRSGLDRAEVAEAARTLRSGRGDAAVVARALSRARRAGSR